MRPERIDPQRLSKSGGRYNSWLFAWFQSTRRRHAVAPSGTSALGKGRLPQELCLQGITAGQAAHRFLRQQCLMEFNRRFALPAAQPNNAFLLF